MERNITPYSALTVSIGDINIPYFHDVRLTSSGGSYFAGLCAN